jgi:hypothetical protein
VKKSSKLRCSKMIETLQGSYLKPYSDITTAGSPFPAAIINWFSYLMGKKKLSWQWQQNQKDNGLH